MELYTENWPASRVNYRHNPVNRVVTLWYRSKPIQHVQPLLPDNRPSRSRESYRRNVGSRSLRHDARSAIYTFPYSGFLTFGMVGMKLVYPTHDDQVLAKADGVSVGSAFRTSVVGQSGHSPSGPRPFLSGLADQSCRLNRYRNSTEVPSRKRAMKILNYRTLVGSSC